MTPPAPLTPPRPPATVGTIDLAQARASHDWNGPVAATGGAPDGRDDLLLAIPGPDQDKVYAMVDDLIKETFFQGHQSGLPRPSAGEDRPEQDRDGAVPVLVPVEAKPTTAAGGPGQGHEDVEFPPFRLWMTLNQFFIVAVVAVLLALLAVATMPIPPKRIPMAIPMPANESVLVPTNQSLPSAVKDLMAEASVTAAVDDAAPTVNAAWNDVVQVLGDAEPSAHASDTLATTPLRLEPVRPGKAGPVTEPMMPTPPALPWSVVKWVVNALLALITVYWFAMPVTFNQYEAAVPPRIFAGLLRHWQRSLQRTGRTLHGTMQEVNYCGMQFRTAAYATLTAEDLKRVLKEGFRQTPPAKADKAALVAALAGKYAEALFEQPSESIHEILRVRGAYAPADCNKVELVRLAVEAGI